MKEETITLIAALKQDAVPFSDVIKFIETYYHYQPIAFKNGDTYNETGQNQGSAKVLAFGKLNNLSKKETLYLFAEHYQSVLANPAGTDHQNIRQFMVNGWPGIVFEGEVLVAK